MLIFVFFVIVLFVIEVIGFKFYGGCIIDSFVGCFMEIVIFWVLGWFV